MYMLVVTTSIIAIERAVGICVSTSVSRKPAQPVAVMSDSKSNSKRLGGGGGGGGGSQGHAKSSSETIEADIGGDARSRKTVDLVLSGVVGDDA